MEDRERRGETDKEVFAGLRAEVLGLRRAWEEIRNPNGLWRMDRQNLFLSEERAGDSEFLC